MSGWNAHFGRRLVAILIGLVAVTAGVASAARPARPTYIQVWVGGPGTVTITAPHHHAVVANRRDAFTAPINARVQMYAKPNRGSRFEGWAYSPCAPNATHCNFTVNQRNPYTIHAIFLSGP
jgi:hypothetical protein